VGPRAGLDTEDRGEIIFFIVSPLILLGSIINLYIIGYYLSLCVLFMTVTTVAMEKVVKDSQTYALLDRPYNQTFVVTQLMSNECILYGHYCHTWKFISFLRGKDGKIQTLEWTTVQSKRSQMTRPSSTLRERAMYIINAMIVATL
jgi:hypothetical protein